MTREFGVRPDAIVAAIGPSIGACCYEVGDELLTAFKGAGHPAADCAAWFARDRGGRLRLDLWRANADLLARAGVPAGQVHVAGLCTKTHVDVVGVVSASRALAPAGWPRSSEPRTAASG